MERIPSIDLEYIQDIVHKYTEGELAHVHGGKIPMDGTLVSSAEEYLAEYTEYDRPMTHEEVVTIMTALLESGCLNEDSQHLAKLLINNPRYSRKMVWVCDGSYRNNRIWFDYDTDLSIRCLRSYKKYDSIDFTGKSVKYKLNWMWNHYDTIYLQVPRYKSVDDVYKNIGQYADCMLSLW